MYRIDINDAYPTSAEVYSHELNDGKVLTIGFYENDEALTLTGATVTATIVCNKALVAEDVSVSLSQSLTNAVDFNVCSTSDYTIRPGVMLVEFKISKNSKLMYPVVPMIINITPSIRNDAQVTPESYGTVSEILQEVAEARGTYNSLGQRLDGVDDKFPIDTQNIKDDAVTSAKIHSGEIYRRHLSTLLWNEIQSRVYYGEIGTGTATSFDTYDGESAVYTVTVDGVKYLFWTIDDGTRKVQYRYSKNGMEWRKKENDTWSSWSYAIPDNSINTNKITTAAVTTAKLGIGAVTTAKIDNGAVTAAKIDSGAVTTVKIDSGAVTNPKIATGAVDTEQLANGAVDIDKVANALLITSTSAQVLYDDYHLPTTRFMKENVERKVENPSKVLTFDSNNCINRVVTVLSNQLSVGTILAGDIKAYVPNTITNVTDGFLTTATDLTTLYINNYSDNVTLGTAVQQKIANEELTVYFIDNFNFADLMAISQRQLNERVTAIETTVGEVNTMLENAINGVSE